MRFRLFFALIIIALVGGLTAAQDKVMDEFIGTRGAGFGAPEPSKSTGPKNKGTTTSNTKGSTAASGTKSSTNKGTSRPRTQQAGTSGPKKGAATPNVVGTQGDNSASTGVTADTTVKTTNISSTQGSIGLGYTLYMQDAQGDGVRVDPSREFSEGDSIRLGLETNTDGYLYIFHTEDGRNPQMLFPNAVLDGGNNRRPAHVLETVPSDLSSWFVFDNRPAIERLYIVVSREPLAGVPTGAALVQFCGTKTSNCFWNPPAQVWQRITSSASGGRVVESRAEIAQVKAPPDTLKRGFTLTKSEPAPTVVRMNASSTSGLLVTTIDLVHK